MQSTSHLTQYPRKSQYSGQYVPPIMFMIKSILEINIPATSNSNNYITCIQSLNLTRLKLLDPNFSFIL